MFCLAYALMGCGVVLFFGGVAVYFLLYLAEKYPNLLEF